MIFSKQKTTKKYGAGWANSISYTEMNQKWHTEHLQDKEYWGTKTNAFLKNSLAFISIPLTPP